MASANVGLTGGTPTLEVTPLHHRLPLCGAVAPDGCRCTRGPNHPDDHYAPKTASHDGHHWHD